MTALYLSLTFFFFVLSVYSIGIAIVVLFYLKSNWAKVKSPIRISGMLFGAFPIFLSLAVFFFVKIFEK